MVMNRKSVVSRIGKEPVTAKELEKKGISRNELRRLVRTDEILRVGRGVYQLATADFGDESQFQAASKRIRGRSAVCLLSALAFYNLTDEIPKQVWLLVDANRRSSLKDIRLFRSHKPRWKVGLQEAEGYRITNVERTIVDCITYEHKMGNLGIDALKRAILEKKTTAGRVMDMAVLLKVADRILPFIRMLA